MMIMRLSLALGVLFSVLLMVGGNGMSEQHCDATSALSVLVACESAVRNEGPEVPPPELCCTGMQAFGMPCTCSVITKEIEETISVKRLVDAAKTCGNPLPPASHCGSYRVPPLDGKV